MSEAVIVLDMPSSCYACRFHMVDDLYSVKEKDVCNAYCGVIPENDMKDKPSWCPLKPIPEKMDEYKDQRHPSVSTDNGEFSYYARGWNDCINELVGDEE